MSGDALATWQSPALQPAAGGEPASAAPSADRTFILLPVTGRLLSGTPSSNGPVSSGAVVALELRESGGAFTLQPSWVSHNLSAPAVPIIVNGVAFTLSTGQPPAAGGRGTPAVLHAYDGLTGRRLWHSGKAMSTFASPGSFWTGLGQIYVGTHDGTLYAFGFDDERSYR